MKKSTMLLAALAIAAIPAQAAVVWEGNFELGTDWSKIAEIPASAFADAKDGSVMKINFKDVVYEGDKVGQVQIAVNTTGWSWTQIVDCADIKNDAFTYVIEDVVFGDTDETILEMIQFDGIKIKGQSATIVSVELTDANGGDIQPDAENVIWEGTVDLDKWNGCAEIPASAFATIAEGQKVVLYFEQLGETPQVQLAGKTPEDYAWTEIIGSADIVNGKYTYKVTDAVVGDTEYTDVEMLKANGLFVKGQDAVVTKVCIAGGSTAVTTIDADENAPVEIYTLDGRRVNKADKGIYIIRQGAKAIKVIR